jgi:hypothetical protein
VKPIIILKGKKMENSNSTELYALAGKLKDIQDNFFPKHDGIQPGKVYQDFVLLDSNAQKKALDFVRSVSAMDFFRVIHNIYLAGLTLKKDICEMYYRILTPQEMKIPYYMDMAISILSPHSELFSKFTSKVGFFCVDLYKPSLSENIITGFDYDAIRRGESEAIKKVISFFSLIMGNKRVIKPKLRMALLNIAINMNLSQIHQLNVREKITEHLQFDFFEELLVYQLKNEKNINQIRYIIPILHAMKKASTGESYVLDIKTKYPAIINAYKKALSNLLAEEVTADILQQAGEIIGKNEADWLELEYKSKQAPFNPMAAQIAALTQELSATRAELNAIKVQLTEMQKTSNAANANNSDPRHNGKPSGTFPSR